MLQDKVIKVWELHWFHSFVQIYWTIWLTQIFRAPGRKYMGLSLSIPYFFYKLKFFFCHAIKYKIFNHAQFTIRLSLKFAWSQYKITNCKKKQTVYLIQHIFRFWLSYIPIQIECIIQLRCIIDSLTIAVKNEFSTNLILPSPKITATALHTCSQANHFENCQHK